MSNTEWKKGYEEGFAAGWKAAKGNTPNHTNYSTVYHGRLRDPVSYKGTMAETVSYNPYNINTTIGYETSDLKTIRNLTDHTRIV